MPYAMQCFWKREGLCCSALLPKDGRADKNNEDDQDLPIPVQPNSGLLFVY